MTPHAGQVVAIFRMLGIGCRVTNEAELGNHLVKIAAGEGRTVVCAVTMAVLALLGYECHCACQTQYLVDRNTNNLKPLLEFLTPHDAYKRINYGTLNDICIAKATQNKEFDKNIISYLKDENDSQINSWEKEESKKLPSVLIFDELDNLYCEDFYGKTYNHITLL